MDVTTILGFVGLGTVAAITMVIAWPRRTTSARFIDRSPAPDRPRSRSFTDWFAGDPVLFTGGDGGGADCAAGGDGGGGGGGGCD